jgi:hypothetical protein
LTFFSHGGDGLAFMTIQAPLQSTERDTLTPAREQETAPLIATDSEPIADSLPLLDHRTRSRAIPTQLAPRGHYLAFKQGEEERLVPLEANITHIGRGIGADVRIEDQRVSRSHAIIVKHGRYARVLDNRSSHGTFLNGRRIVATNIQTGDVIRLGPVTMQYLSVR